LYRKIRAAVDAMTDLINSLLEYTQVRESLRHGFGTIEATIERAVHTVRARPEFRGLNRSDLREGRCETWFDQKKVERVLANLLVNACEAVSPESGRIDVNLREGKDGVEIRIMDNGPG